MNSTFLTEIPSIRYSFQPGPAQLFPEVKNAVKEAISLGLLSRYHRDAVWRALFAEAQRAVAKHIGLPSEWLVLFVSSATEAWQVITDAFGGLRSLHIIQGEFGRRWFRLHSYAAGSTAQAAEISADVPWEALPSTLREAYGSPDLLCVVHVETSVGAWLPDLRTLRQAFPQSLIVVDATSSMGGLSLPWDVIDGALASVQKCLGLPPGLAVLVLSPRLLNEGVRQPPARYNSLSYLIERAQQHEPPHTPNLLNLYLLARVLPQQPPAALHDKRLRERAFWLIRTLEKLGYRPLLPAAYQAPTVLGFCWRSSAEGASIRKAAETRGLYIGWGYGSFKTEAFRIANFPALPDAAYEELTELMANF